MGVPTFPDQGPPRAARSIRFQFAVRLAIPVAVLVLLWGAAAGAALGGTLRTLPGFSSAPPRNRGLVEASAVGGAGLVVVLVAVLLAGMFASRLSRQIAGLAAEASRLAEEPPQVVQRLRDGEPPAGQAGAARRPDTTPAGTAEIAAAAAALASMQRTAIAAATAEAGVRNGLREILVSLGKRNQSLLHRQLRIIDTLEQEAESPAALAELFMLDHLTTRMRRHADSLSIMSGAAPARSWIGPVPVIDVIRAAVAEIEDYKRVSVLTDTEEAVIAAAVTDMIHLLAELIENATLFSPSTTRVEVRAERVANGFVIEIEDRGLGVPPDQLRDINEQLANPPDFDMADADRLGLFVTGRLAARQGVQVSLVRSAYRGVKAVVVLPDGIVMTPEEQAPAESAPRLNLRSSEALSLVGAVHARSLSTVDAAGETQYPAAPDAFGEDPGDTFHGLPRRVRPRGSSQARGGGQPQAGPAGAMSAHVPPEAPTPDHARNLISSLQSSWQLSRQADDTPDSELAASEPSVEWPDNTGQDATPHGGGTTLDDEEM